MGYELLQPQAHCRAWGGEIRLLPIDLERIRAEKQKMSHQARSLTRSGLTASKALNSPVGEGRRCDAHHSSWHLVQILPTYSWCERPQRSDKRRDTQEQKAQSVSSVSTKMMNYKSSQRIVFSVQLQQKHARSRCSSPHCSVRPEGARHQWRKVSPRELSIYLVADERFGWATGQVKPRDKSRLGRFSNQPAGPPRAII